MAYTLEQTKSIIEIFPAVENVRLVTDSDYPNTKDLFFTFKEVDFRVYIYKDNINVYCPNPKFQRNALHWTQHDQYDEIANSGRNMKVITEKAFMAKLAIAYSQYLYAVECVEANTKENNELIEQYNALVGTYHTGEYNGIIMCGKVHGPFRIDLSINAKDNRIIEGSFSYGYHKITEYPETAIAEYKNASEHWKL